MRDETKEQVVGLIVGVVCVVVVISVAMAILAEARDYDYEPLCLRKCNEEGMPYAGTMHIVHVICGCGMYCDCEGGSVPVCDYDINPNCMMYFLGTPLIAVGVALIMLRIYNKKQR